jgi:hypothetical protein
MAYQHKMSSVVSHAKEMTRPVLHPAGLLSQALWLAHRQPPCSGSRDSSSKAAVHPPGLPNPNIQDVDTPQQSLPASHSHLRSSLLARCSALSGLAFAQYRAVRPPVPAVGWLKLLRHLVADRAPKLAQNAMSTGGEAAPTAAANAGAPGAAGNPAPQLESAVVDGAAEGDAGPGLGDRFDGGRLATVLQGSVADQQVTPASTVAAAMEQPLPAQPEQPGLANAAQFLPFVQLPQQPASVPLQQPASQPAAGDDAAEQQRILQQSAQLQQQQVGDLRFRLGRHFPVQCPQRGVVTARSAGRSPAALRVLARMYAGLCASWQLLALVVTLQGVNRLQPDQCSSVSGIIS